MSAKTDRERENLDTRAIVENNMLNVTLMPYITG